MTRDPTCHDTCYRPKHHSRGAGADRCPARRPGQVQSDVALLSSFLRIVESSEAALRLQIAHEWLLAHAGRGAVIVGASRGRRR